MPTVIHQIKSTSGLQTISVPSQLPERSEPTEATNSGRLAAWRDEIKAMLAGAKIAVGRTWTVELSHHHGLEHFDEVGCTLITCIERAYCKKLLILFAGQMHPEHYHKEKEETFEVLAGTFLLNLNGERRLMFPGEAQTILPGQWHGFTSEHGWKSRRATCPAVQCIGPTTSAACTARLRLGWKDDLNDRHRAA